MTLPKLPFVSILWDDAWGDMTTAVSLENVHESHKPERILTRGWLLREDDVGISLANEICADGTYRGRSFILKGMVVDVVHHSVSRKKVKNVALSRSNGGEGDHDSR